MTSVIEQDGKLYLGSLINDAAFWHNRPRTVKAIHRG